MLVTNLSHARKQNTRLFGLFLKCVGKKFCCPSNVGNIFRLDVLSKRTSHRATTRLHSE
jgi:hypothetical protein